LTVIRITRIHRNFMKKLRAEIATRLVAAIVVTVAVIGLSAFGVHAPTQNQNSLARSLKSIQTEKATMFYAAARPDGAWFVEEVLPTGDGNIATENLESVAATH